jgi:hypothetical protein
VLLPCSKPQIFAWPHRIIKDPSYFFIFPLPPLPCGSPVACAPSLGLFFEQLARDLLESWYGTTDLGTAVTDPVHSTKKEPAFTPEIVAPPRGMV